MSTITKEEAERLITRKNLGMQSAPEGDALVALARETRRSAERFSATVRRFSEEMPSNLDRFHDAMRAFRNSAKDLRAAAV